MKSFDVTLYYSLDPEHTCKLFPRPTEVERIVVSVNAPDQETACHRAVDQVRTRPGVRDVMVEDSHESDTTAGDRLYAACKTRGDLDVPALLDFLADRLVEVHGESKNVDFILTAKDRARRLRLAMDICEAENSHV